MKFYGLIWMLWCLLPFSAKAQKSGANLRVLRIYYQDQPKLKEEIEVSPNDTTIYNGRYLEYFENGLIKTKGKYEQNEAVGLWEYYYESGQLKSSGYWSEDVSDGLWQHFYENGTASSSGMMSKGLKQGEWQYFYESGKIKQKGEFNKGIRSGPWSYFFEDGKLKAEVSYKLDTGLYTSFYAEGGKFSSGWLSGNKSFGLWSYYYQNGNLKATGEERNGKREGVWKEYYEDGSLASEGAYKEGTADGPWRYYYQGGALMAEGQERQGLKEGTWKLYHESGVVKSTVNYVNGSGAYEEYYESGKMKVKGAVIKGLYSGWWEFLYESGEVEGRCHYQEGKGEFVGYYEGGQLRMEGRLKNAEKEGVWKLYDKEGSLSGYYVASQDKDNSRNPGLNVDFSAEPIRQVQPKTPAGSRVKKKGTPLRFFYSSPNEFRAIVVLTNPLSIFLNTAPVSVEYYMEQRLGYEIGYAFIRNPFFERFSSRALELPYGNGFWADIKQKFYLPRRQYGMLYFAHEARYTQVGYKAKFLIDPLDPQSISLTRANVQRYEYTLMLGNRVMKKSDVQGFVIDLFLGIGLGYRVVTVPSFDNGRIQTIFAELDETRLFPSYRLGFNIGYAF